MLMHLTKQMLSAHYDGELLPSTMGSVGDHLYECAECREDYEKLAGLTNAVRHIRRREAPSSLASTVRARVDTELRGMVPVLRGQILSDDSRPGFLKALSLGTVTTLLLLSLLGLMVRYGAHATESLEAALIPGPLPPPVLLHETMASPRFRDGSVGHLPFAEVERGKEGTLLTLASIDQNGTIRGLEVIYRSGDEQMLTRTLEVLMDSGFEPARLGDRAIPVNFLYLFTTTEVRAKRSDYLTSVVS